MPAQIRPREFRFPVHVQWESGRRTIAEVEGKEPLPIATPPVFKGSDPELWSPEDAFAAAAGSCLAVTVAALVEREQLPMRSLSVSATAVAGRRPDGRFGFIRIEQTVAAETDEEHVDALRAVIAKAEGMCLVSVSLDLPIETSVEIKPRVAVS